jgi:DNA (cytosine-5)-methyltransferase 1
VENVDALLQRGIERILGDLAASGFDAEWEVLPAAAFGAPDIRHRTFICAYTAGMLRTSIFGSESHGNLSSHAYSRILADTYRSQRPQWEGIGEDPFSQFSPAQRSMRSCGAWDRGPFDDGAVDDGISASVDALDAYGNAVVPQVAEWIGRRILAATPGANTDA